LAYGRLPWAEPDPSTLAIYLLDLKTKKTTALPGSRGFFSPHWSYDGRYIAVAPGSDSSKLVLYDFTTGKWTPIVDRSASNTSGTVAHENWSRDGQYVYFESILAGDPAVYRVRIRDQKLEQVVSLKEFHQAWGTAGPWLGLTPDEAPLLLRDMGTEEIYALEWQRPVR
jgi:hypothetical protein